MSHLNTNHFAVQIHSHWSALLNDVNMDYDSPKFMGWDVSNLNYQMKMKNKLLRYEKFCNHDICGMSVFNTLFLPLCLTCMQEVNVINA